MERLRIRKVGCFEVIEEGGAGEEYIRIFLGIVLRFYVYGV